MALFASVAFSAGSVFSKVFAIERCVFWNVGKLVGVRLLAYGTPSDDRRFNNFLIYVSMQEEKEIRNVYAQRRFTVVLKNHQQQRANTIR